MRTRREFPTFSQRNQLIPNGRDDKGIRGHLAFTGSDLERFRCIGANCVELQAPDLFEKIYTALSTFHVNADGSRRPSISFR